MSIVNAKEIMIPAAKEGWAVGAFNVTDLLQFEAVIDAAIEKRTPVIVQTSVKPLTIFRDTDDGEYLPHTGRVCPSTSMLAPRSLHQH
ncbi:class II fructose-bisphosphate aldolase [Candidatus Villigracilis saccharophilus]|uniref:class II fructose-bisphosphate aldolase n=1 Tax=Candidatus Villigracilis saccharophilus TaxID=3140684 RepID=UPI0031367CE4|nr:class II fructose-bisphosphate aldolase [Anaerolineales bacterium]